MKRRNILIGSRALAYWDRGFTHSDTADYDVISEEPIDGTEHHSLDVLNNADVEFYTSSDFYIQFNGTKLYLALPHCLAAIKRSHLHRELGFDKHITQYHKHLEKYIRYSSYDIREFLKTRTRLTLEQYPQPKPNLKKSVQDFFTDGVVKIHDHDYIHELVAAPTAPLYKSLQDDPSVVWCGKDKWDTFSHDQKLKCVSEEVSVLAIERFLVPREWNYPSKLAYLNALKKVCTTVTSGYFRDCAIDNYPAIIKLYNEQTFKSVKSKLTNGN